MYFYDNYSIEFKQNPFSFHSLCRLVCYKSRIKWEWTQKQPYIFISFICNLIKWHRGSIPTTLHRYNLITHKRNELFIQNNMHQILLPVSYLIFRVNKHGKCRVHATTSTFYITCQIPAADDKIKQNDGTESDVNCLCVRQTISQLI